MADDPGSPRISGADGNRRGGSGADGNRRGGSGTDGNRRGGSGAEGNRPGGTGRGPGRLLVAIYGLFAVAAGARAGVQIATRFHEAPVAYLLSALAAVVYLVATLGLARGGVTGRRIALVACTTELVGVLIVGTFSVADRAAFPDDTVW